MVLANTFLERRVAIEALLTGDSSYLSAHSGDILTVGAGVGLLSGAAATVSQTSLQLEQAYNENLNALLSDLFGITPPSSTLPPGYTNRSFNGVNWVTDENGKVVYGSVQAPISMQIPILSDTVQISLPNQDGTNLSQLTLNPDGTISFTANTPFLNYSSQDPLGYNFSFGQINNSANASSISQEAATFSVTGQLEQNFLKYTNDTFSLTKNAYSASGVLTDSVSVNNLFASALATDASGNNILTLDSFGDKLILTPGLQGTLDNAQGGVIVSYAPGTLAYATETSSGQAVIGTVSSSGDAGQLLNLSLLNTNGTFTPDGIAFNNPDGLFNGSFSQAGTDASALATDIRNGIGFDTATGPINNTLFPTLSVSVLSFATGSGNQSSELTGSVVNGIVISQADAQAGTGENQQGTDSIANTDGLFPNAQTNVMTGNYRPGNDILQTPENIVSDVVSGIANATAGAVNSLAQFLGFSDLAAALESLLNTDPLLIDLTEQDIQVSNWINSPVYFNTNVGSNGLADGQLHRTGWVRPGTGILALDINGDGKINDITETLSQFFQGGSAPGKYADGLAALASLAKGGAMDFNATTALIDPKTSVSYFNEVVVWQDANQNGVTDAGELKTLAQLGITNISLVGTGNQGENINGSSITNRTTYTKTDGSTGQVAAVNLQTDTTGDVTVAANGGITITSTPEGGAGATNSFVDQSATAQTYNLSGGVLHNSTTNVTSGTGITAVFATNQNDSITVASGDTGSYWLGGGTSAATLNGGSGNTMFLINSQTVVHGGGTRGQNFNIAEVMASAPITVDLKTDNLDEVIGGAGNGTFNASGTTWSVFIQGGSGNNIIIGGAAHDALSGGTGDDLIEGGSGGSLVHAGSGNDVIYGGSGTTNGTRNSDIIYGGPGHDTVILGTDNSEVVAGTGAMTLIGNTGGFSVLRLSGSYADYTITHNADGTTTIMAKTSGQDGPVTFKNITDLDFSDINQIPVNGVANSTALMPVNDTVQVSGNGPYTILASTLIANDLNFAGNTISIRELLDNNGNSIARGHSGQVNGGTASLSSDGTTITFAPQLGFTGVMSFRYHAEDSKGNGGIMASVIGSSTQAEMSATVTLLTPSDPTNTPFPDQWYLAAINVLPAWDMGYTAGVKIGVFESDNIDFSNPGLTANEGGEFSAANTPGIEQIGSHATLVGGVIAGVLGGTEGVGVAYGARLFSEAMPGPASNSTDLSVLNDWVNYDIVNNSWGWVVPFDDNFLGDATLANSFQNAATNGRSGLGTIIVFAGGNERATGGNTNYNNSSNSQYEITVGGINAPSDLGSLQFSGAPFSNPGTSILVSAPANNITSTGVTMTNEYGERFGANSETVAGTSLAAPIVSGVVALMFQANPKLGGAMSRIFWR